MGPVNVNVENVGRDTRRVYVTNNGESGAAEGGRYVVYTGGGGSAGSGGNSISNNLNWPQKGDSVTVGGAATDI